MCVWCVVRTGCCDEADVGAGARWAEKCQEVRPRRPTLEAVEQRGVSCEGRRKDARTP